MVTEHDEMMIAFEKTHGALADYSVPEERDMWMGWLGNFTLGWDAHKKRTDATTESLARES
jgi:hypothetical protein